MIVSSTTSTDPDVGHDWLYVHSPSTSAFAGFAINANKATGMNISQREFTTYQVGSEQILTLFLQA
jgi:hypothetical protein